MIKFNPRYHVDRLERQDTLIEKSVSFPFAVYCKLEKYMKVVVDILVVQKFDLD